MKANYQNLWKVLKEKNITIEELREAVKISSPTITKIENGEVLSDSILEKIAKHLGCKPRDIMDLEKDETEEFKVKESKGKYKVVSLFSGAGGMDLGFIQAGFDIIWANDIIPEAIETYKKNIGNHIVFGDIRMISSNDIPDNPDVIIGGFPCQGFSIANTRRSMEDQRNFLYKEMLRIIKDKKPKMFVAENVKGLLSMEKAKL